MVVLSVSKPKPIIACLFLIFCFHIYIAPYEKKSPQTRHISRTAIVQMGLQTGGETDEVESIRPKLGFNYILTA
jgi:hypothetical protein